MGNDLTIATEKALGSAGSSAKSLASGELDAELTHHKNLLLSWHNTINGMLALGLINQEILPLQWLALVQFLQLSLNQNDAPVEVDLLLEEAVLNNQDSNGESIAVDNLAEVFVENDEHDTSHQRGPLTPV